MSTVMVNARVSAADKSAADRVLAANRSTWSQVIQSLAAYMTRTGSYPEWLLEPSDDAEQQRRTDLLMSVAGISHSPDLASDSRTADILYEALTARHA
ncbi:MAG: type II toxin-antitoxin system RelB/DinJ family antitoxin [Propionibacteriaceae bacterium]|nr:type II toxin-antitoxin system RelB/DinJ family antitoxin [Propionibacteriaceae bacterium]